MAVKLLFFLNGAYEDIARAEALAVLEETVHANPSAYVTTLMLAKMTAAMRGNTPATELLRQLLKRDDITEEIRQQAQTALASFDH